ncbi:methyltransferase domain protein, partial [Teladorsagia circumcincta]
MRYGDYGVLGSVLEKYLKSSDNILQIGCGNSQMASQMYDNGFRNVHSIDTDSAVIEKQCLRNRERPELRFSKDDATSMSFADEEFSVVVDKGTLDALLPPEATEHQLDCVHKMFCEVQRVLKVAGRYLIITLAQHHIVKCFMEHFLSTRQFLLRVHEIENSASGFPMPVFILFATKLRSVMTMTMDRLAVVTLSRSQTYSSLKQVQDELGPFATRFDPRENGGLASVEGIELDRDVVNVAIQWFALAHRDPRMTVKVMDALVYLQETAIR